MRNSLKASRAANRVKVRNRFPIPRTFTKRSLWSCVFSRYQRDLVPSLPSTIQDEEPTLCVCSCKSIPFCILSTASANCGPNCLWATALWSVRLLASLQKPFWSNKLRIVSKEALQLGPRALSRRSTSLEWPIMTSKAFDKFCTSFTANPSSIGHGSSCSWGSNPLLGTLLLNLTQSFALQQQQWCGHVLLNVWRGLKRSCSLQEELWQLELLVLACSLRQTLLPSRPPMLSVPCCAWASLCPAHWAGSGTTLCSVLVATCRFLLRPIERVAGPVSPLLSNALPPRRLQPLQQSDLLSRPSSPGWRCLLEQEWDYVPAGSLWRSEIIGSSPASPSPLICRAPLQARILLTPALEAP